MSTTYFIILDFPDGLEGEIRCRCSSNGGPCDVAQHATSAMLEAPDDDDDDQEDTSTVLFGEF